MMVARNTTLMRVYIRKKSESLQESRQKRLIADLCVFMLLLLCYGGEYFSSYKYWVFECVSFFYVDNVLVMGDWSKDNTICSIRLLECFFMLRVIE